MKRFTCKFIPIFPNSGDPETEIQEKESIADLLHHYLTLASKEPTGDTIRIHINLEREVATLDDGEQIIEMERRKGGEEHGTVW